MGRTQRVDLDYLQLYRLKWVLGNVLALVSLSGLWAVDVGGRWAALLAMAAVLLVMAFPHVKARLPQAPWLGVVPLLACAIVTDFVLAGGDLLPPLLRLLLLLTAIRALQFRTRREDRQLVILSLFVLLICAVLTQELAFALRGALFVPLAMGVLFIITLSESYEEPETPPYAWDHFSWFRAVPEWWSALNLRLAVVASVLTLGFIGVTAVFFILLPRFDLGHRIPLPQLGGGSSRTGFSEQVAYGDVVSIQEDAGVALRVDVPEDFDGERTYWRMVVLDAYTRDGFQMSESLKDSRERRQGYHLSAPAEWQNSGELSGPWTLYFEGNISRFLPIPGRFGHIELSRTQPLERYAAGGLLALPQAPRNVLSLRWPGVRVNTPVRGTHADRLLRQGLNSGLWAAQGAGVEADAPVDYPWTTLELPQGLAARQLLARELEAIEARVGEARELSSWASAAIEALARDHAYSLDSELPEGAMDPLLRWLASDSAGHCEYYAGALTLLARAAGFPARMVVGYAGGDWNGFEDYLMVRNRHAHAWTEIFDARANLWLRFDPTPSAGLPPMEVPLVADADAVEAAGPVQGDRSWRAYVDSLRLVWYRRVIDFDEDQQQALVGGARAWASQRWEAAQAQLSQGSAYVSQRVRTVWRDAGSTIAARRELWLALACLVCAAVLVWRTWRRGLFQPWRILGRERQVPLRRRAQSAQRRRAGRWLRRLQARWAKASVDPDAMLMADLQCVRYGPVAAWPAWGDVERRARKAARQRR